MSAKNRTPYTDSALHIIKGALCSVIGLPCGRSTRSVKFLKGQKAVISVGPVSNPLTSEDEEDIRNSILSKVLEDAPFRVVHVPRNEAELLYGDAMYDEFGVPQSVTSLRLVILAQWNINANQAEVVKSTGRIGSIHVSKLKHVGEKNNLEVHFEVFPPGTAAPPRSTSPPDHTTKDEGTAPKSEPPQAESENVDVVAELAVAEAVPFNDLPSLSEVVPEKQHVQASDPTQLVTPWDVSAEGGIRYDKLLQQFGCSAITDKLVDRIERITKRKAHHLLRRRIFFAHRDLEQLLQSYETGKPFYLYTGRGPSSSALHLGHLVPFLFTKWLQDAFNVPVVIQLTDDEKFLFKDNLDLEEAHRLAYENTKDIIAVGFDPEKTFIFSDIDYIHNLYPIVLKIQKKVTYSQIRGIFGFTEGDNIGKVGFPAVQAAPAFSPCFPEFLGKAPDMRCLIPQGIDQDPYFRMTRDVAPRLGFVKPSLIHSGFFPALQGFETKMSGSVESSSIFVTDSPEVIRKKIHRYAFSGGGDTEKEQREKGANLSVDVAYQYLRFMMDDDDELEDIGRKYAAGEMLTGEVKDFLCDLLVKITEEHQKRRNAVTSEDIKRIMRGSPISLA